MRTGMKCGPSIAILSGELVYAYGTMPNLDEMMEDLAEARIKELEDRCSKASREYYNGQPLIPDELYDALRDELAELRASSPVVKAVGAPPPDESPWLKASHGVPMGSLDKVNTMEELTVWITDITPRDVEGRHQFGQLFVTEKMDGISLHVRYVKGVLTQALTLGDGKFGEDIARNVLKMKGVPPKLTGPGKGFTGSLRGEIIILKSDFDLHFRDAGYETTRNAAGGVAKRLDGRGVDNLSVFFYSVLDGKSFDTEAEQFEWLSSLGLSTPNWYVTAMVPGVQTPHDLWIEYQQSKRILLDYEIDGLVVRVNHLEQQMSLGEKDDRPKGAKAFKFAPVTRETSATSVEEQTGGSGTITPVAIFNPVTLLGATVTRASLYNWRYIRQLGFDVGARILVARANDVIPRVVSVIKGTGKVYPPPTKCTSCGSAPVEDGEYWVCPNTAGCPAQVVGRIRRYIKALNILEIGETLIDKLVVTGLVTDVASLYRLKEEQIAGVDRMGKRSAQKVIKSLWSVNPVPLETLLGGLSIPGCAESTVALVMDAGLDTLEVMRSTDRSVFEKITGLGPVKAQSLSTWLGEYGPTVDDILATGLKIKERIKGTLTGKSFCFTGTMPSGRKRADMEGFVKDRGGTVKTSVSKGLTFLVLGDPEAASTKAQTAKKNGTKCLTEPEFNTLVGVS